jgi:hypothetical protein
MHKDGQAIIPITFYIYFQPYQNLFCLYISNQADNKHTNPADWIPLLY